MLRQLHDGMMACITDNGAISEAFAVTNGVKQGCDLTPNLFSLMFSAMLMDAYHDERPGIHTAYRMDGQLLNQWRMCSQSRVSTATIHEVLFTAECALNALTEGEIQRSMDLFAAACGNFVMFSNMEKMVVLHQPLPNTTYNAPRIYVNGTQIKAVDTFTYLGSNLSRSTQIRRILKLRRQDRILATEVLERPGLLNIFTQLRKLQLRWSGPTVKMDDERLPQ
ncbi:unnamed protein product [Schistocephalus solidus]|uniref:Reverse transcriptase domain-containing protein n=1 Tax=Schistocephalus solidus TaxID=70667 RepID=A0A183TKU4_SCHSO|nr:unnamed protein product [Schistocephalus solidus]